MSKSLMLSLVVASALALGACGGSDAPAGDASEAPVANINQEEAFAIALQNAGLKEDEVTLEGVELETDDAKAVYEVRFCTNTMEYDYDVDAATGALLSTDVEYRD